MVGGPRSLLLPDGVKALSQEVQGLRRIGVLESRVRRPCC